MTDEKQEKPALPGPIETFVAIGVLSYLASEYASSSCACKEGIDHFGSRIIPLMQKINAMEEDERLRIFLNRMMSKFELNPKCAHDGNHPSEDDSPGKQLADALLFGLQAKGH